ncbi:MAG TPA: MlaD family protein [Chitinophagaceae bacterium]|nr:MlaD family protein [Chitinophagaceae bacterium]HPN58529.1 MlaD family protein [Chitinophagaceae bacterium]
MKISNETKVGILTIVALVILIVGFNFLKGKDVFSRSKKIYAVFKELGTLEKSNEAKINGLPIGNVYDKKERDKDVSAVVVTISLTRDINIPKNSVAYISSSLVGSSYIVIERGNSTEMMGDGDTLSTRMETGILGDVKAQMNPTMARIRDVLDSLKETLSGVNGMLNMENKAYLKETLANLSQASNALNGLLDNKNGALAKTLNNAQAMTESLKNNSEDITATIGNAKKVSEKLAALELQPTIDSLNTMISSLKATAAKLNSSDGTLGALMNDRALYDKLNNAILSAEILIDDLRTHPKRYVNLSIFGKKDKTGPLTSPAKKDTAAAAN